MSANSTTVKVVLLGEGKSRHARISDHVIVSHACNVSSTHTAGRVGKTSVAYRFVHDTFNHNQQATLQASFLSKEVQAQGHKVSNLYEGVAPEDYCISSLG